MLNFKVVQLTAILVFSNVPNFLRFIGLPFLWLVLVCVGGHTTFKELFKTWSDYAVLTMLHRK